MDELAQSGRFDLKTDGDVDIYLAELKGFTEDKGLAEWEIVGEESVPRSLLHYDDTADGSNTLNGSWREFYATKCNFGERPLYIGSSIFYKDGMPNFRGVAKATIYLRYSDGFLKWLEIFDVAAADNIRSQLSAFECLVENPTTKKLINAWDKFKAPKRKWALPVVCSLSDNSKIVLGLAGSENDDWDDLKDLDVNVQRSIELMLFFAIPGRAQREIISDMFQMGRGLGRNPFGQDCKLDKISDSEYIRLMGPISKNSRRELLDIWTNKPSYRIKVAPNPDTSELIFMPEGDLKYSQLKRFVDSEKHKKQAFFEARKAKKKKNEDTESIIAPTPAVIPIPADSQSTLFLVNIEGSQKKKLIIQQVFPSVSLDYLACLNEEMLRNNTMVSVVSYMKVALTCQDRETPCIYRYWTEVFTSALQKRYISANEIFYSFQRFSKAFRGEELIGKRKAREYFRVIARLRRLQHLIHAARNSPGKLNTIEFQTTLKAVEQYQLTEKGVFSMMKECPQTAELVGPVYGSLWDWQKEKLDAFVKQAWQGVPDDDFNLFVRGALTGILLNELAFAVTKAGRSFSITQGRHPSTLRGEQILSLLTKGVGLLINLEEQQRFNCKTLPFIKSCLEESRKDTFNSGLIMGLVFIYKSQEKETQND